jgi:hypothetical protein
LLSLLTLTLSTSNNLNIPSPLFRFLVLLWVQSVNLFCMHLLISCTVKLFFFLLLPFPPSLLFI